MNIYFTTLNNQRIEESEAVKLEEFNKIYEANGVMKKRETYYNCKFLGITYYRDSNETEAQAINLLQSQGYQNFGIVERTVSGNNIIETHCSYRNGNLKLKGRIMIDSNGLWLAEEEIDISTNLPMYDRTKKYYYNSSFGLDFDDPILSCDYDSAGNFSELCFGYSIDEQDAEYCFAGDNPDDIRQLCGLTVSEMSFYLTAAF